MKAPQMKNAVLVALCVCAWVGSVSYAYAADPALQVGRPFEHDGNFVADVHVEGLFDEKVVDLLESELPGTFVLSWRLFQVRDAWWDREVERGETFYRIFYDLLDERFDVFDDVGRPVASCGTVGELESAVCRDQQVTTVSTAELAAGRRYYLTVEASIELLDEEEVRGLEGWLRGSPEDEGGELLPGLSAHAVGLLTDMSELGSRSVSGTSAKFDK